MMAPRIAAYIVRLFRPDGTLHDDARFPGTERGFDQALAQWETWYRAHGALGYTVTREPVLEVP